jgi:hypothetical protein
MAKNFTSLSYWSKRRIASNTVNLWYSNEANDEETVHSDEFTSNFAVASMTNIMQAVENHESNMVHAVEVEPAPANS